MIEECMSGRERDLRVSFVDFPEALEPIVRQDFASVAWLVPTWCTFVCVSYDTSSEGGDDATMSSVSSSVEYRQAHVMVRPGYFAAHFNPVDRSETLAHEVVHIATAPLVNYAEERIGMLAEGDERLAKVVLQEMRERVEGMTQDLARAISRRSWFAGCNVGLQA